MLHEVLIALAGHPGDIFVERERGARGGPVSDIDVGSILQESVGFKVSSFVDFIGPSEKEELEDLVDVGYRYKRLHALINNQLKNPKSSYGRVMCLAMKKIADEYVMKVARVEKEVLRASVKSHLTHSALAPFIFPLQDFVYVFLRYLVRV